MLRTVFFDIGGVVLSNAWDHLERARAWAHFEIDPAECEARHEPPALALERGEITLDDYLAQVVFFRSRSFSTAQFREFMRACSVPRPEAIAVVGELAEAGRARLATLNNESRELNEYRIAHFSLQRLFSVFCSSCYLGVRKPGTGIYRRALGILQAEPAECLFVDDREENLAAPRSLGIESLRFESAPQLRAQLLQRGLL